VLASRFFLHIERRARHGDQLAKWSGQERSLDFGSGHLGSRMIFSISAVAAAVWALKSIFNKEI
jgi:hypothetical protein